jgi:hypothetical protein
VTVTRATQPERYEIYTATLQKKLPRFRLPLAADDRDTVLDLQAAFNRSFDQGGFAAKVEYGREPAVSLGEEDRHWVAELLQKYRPAEKALPTLLQVQATAREPSTSQEEIAVAAYHLWQQEGCPHGRDQEHWHRAVEQLRQQKRAGRP